MSGLTLSGTEVRLRIIDETQTPLSSAQVLIAFTTPVIGGAKLAEGLSDSQGVFSGSGQAIGSVFVRASKEGYYPARIESLPNDRDLDEIVVLPKIIEPIPLLARHVGVGKRNAGRQPQELSPSGETFGFDFAVGEMVAPYGDGKVADILFKIRNEFKGWKFSDAEMARTKQIPANRNITEQDMKRFYGKYDAELEVTFPDEREGLIEEQAHFLPYSRLKMPHHAPGEGYVPTWHYTANTYSPSTTRANVGFFLRTRVKLDQDGKIISANYAKVMGDFRLDARGGVIFTYYFNPTPNDRNLEFDPKKNLFPPKTPGADVNDP
ncbi:MAG: carboxypeptidase-like regulatory domain-containing protein [Lacunisphaera sp.]